MWKILFSRGKLEDAYTFCSWKSTRWLWWKSRETRSENKAFLWWPLHYKMYSKLRFWMPRNQKVIEKFIFPSNLFSGKCAKRLRYYNFYNIPIEINKPSRKSNPQHTIRVHRGGRGKFPLSHNPSPPQQFWTSLIREFSHFDDISPLSSPITWKNFLPRPNPPSAENFWFPALFPLAWKFFLPVLFPPL